VDKVNKVLNEHRRSDVLEIADSLGMQCGTWLIAIDFLHGFLNDEQRQRKYFASQNMGVITHPNFLA
jgi:hypothetical protein